MNNLKQVTQLMVRMGQEIKTVPEFPSEEILNLRYTLVASELKEFKEKGIDKRDMVEVADALCDLQVVVLGAFNAFGLAPIAHLLFDEVHSSNMSKACKSVEEAQETVDAYYVKGTETKIQEVDGNFIVVRVSDGKFMKSINFKEPNLKAIIDTYTAFCHKS